MQNSCSGGSLLFILYHYSPFFHDLPFRLHRHVVPQFAIAFSLICVAALNSFVRSFSLSIVGTSFSVSRIGNGVVVQFDAVHLFHREQREKRAENTFVWRCVRSLSIALPLNAVATHTHNYFGHLLRLGFVVMHFQ